MTLEHEETPAQTKDEQQQQQQQQQPPEVVQRGDIENQDPLQHTAHTANEETVILFKDDSSGSGSKPHHNQYSLRWSRLVKTVQVQENRTGLGRGSIAGPQESDLDSSKKGPVEKTILNQVSGHAAPGQVMALIGPSGSSKTTLLNTLSGRGSIDSGSITVNGKPLKTYINKIAYVRQEDIFFEHLTVRDQLAYTAFLRMPSSWSRESKLEEVDHIIRSLRLRKVQGSQIKMLSGGEKKRVNIGTELLTNPSCLLLDEPTSGLDSTSAAALIKLLRNLASTQAKTVVMSIHQPSSGMFLNFDSLMMLAEGNVVYFGTPEGSIHYLKELNFPCREGYNIADHWMDLLVSDSAMEEEEEYMKSSYFSSTDLRDDSAENNDDSPVVRNRKSNGQMAREEIRRKRRSTRQQLIEAWDGESVSNKTDSDAKEDGKMDYDADAKVVSKYNTGWVTQYRVLMHRALKNSRSAIFTPLNMVKSALLGIISGLLWFQLEYTERTVQDRTAYFFFTMTYWVFDSMFSSLLAFPSERKVILKVRTEGGGYIFFV
jgi:ABC-type multidrug transport system ATPase subunit